MNVAGKVAERRQQRMTAIVWGQTNINLLASPSGP